MAYQNQKRLVDMISLPLPLALLVTLDHRKEYQRTKHEQSRRRCSHMEPLQDACSVSLGICLSRPSITVHPHAMP